ncbi:MAG: protein kinase [Labilithrix sp.]|nr:protein kinase [Labilithrix sp.]
MSVSVNDAPVLPGETIAAKYKIERVLGQGGMGVVVAARHLELDERVAIKFLVGEPSEAAVDRFLREARAAAKVKGEHVCRVFDFGRLESGEPYIVMEHLEGTDLARKLEREGHQPPDVVVGWVVEACDALAEAHALGIVHRDLKPANVFLANRPDGSTVAKVLDFGISKLPRAEAMTRTAATMGSPAYMSPEQMESSRDVDARSDVWSIGVMMYELLAGAPPFVGESMVQLALMVREREPKPLEGDLPEGLSFVVMKCLAKKPEDRFESVAELASALTPFAPTDVSALAARLARRKPTEMSPPSFALDATAEAVPQPRKKNQKQIATLEDAKPSDADAPSNDETETSRPTKEPPHLARARGTFAPLQSTMSDDEPRPKARRAALAIAALAAIASVAYVARSMSSAPQIAAPNDAALVVATSLPPPTASPPSDTIIATPPPSAIASTTAPVKSVTTVATIKPVALVASTTPAIVPSATVSAVPSAPPVMPAVTTATKPDGPKKRELDRDDP